MHVRPATANDVPGIVDMARQFYATTSYCDWAPFNPETVSALATGLLNEHVMLVAEHDDALVGMVGLFVVPFMFNADMTAAYEVVWWVNEEARATGAGKALLGAIEPACQAKGCDAIQMVHLRNSPPQAAMIYERAGFVHTESSYTKILEVV